MLNRLAILLESLGAPVLRFIENLRLLNAILSISLFRSFLSIEASVNDDDGGVAPTQILQTLDNAKASITQYLRGRVRRAEERDLQKYQE